MVASLPHRAEGGAPTPRGLDQVEGDALPVADADTACEPETDGDVDVDGEGDTVGVAEGTSPVVDDTDGVGVAEGVGDDEPDGQ